MTRSAFVRLTSMHTILMCAIAACAGNISMGWTPSLWTLFIWFGVAIVFIFVGTSRDPIVCFIGTAGMSMALGFMMGPVAGLFSTDAIARASMLTFCAMTFMSALGILVPQAFRGIGPFLMAGLAGLLITQFSQIALMMFGFTEAAHMPIITWIGIVLFLGFIAYDWTEALDGEYTTRNAIATSGQLVLCAANLFIRFLDLMKDWMGIDALTTADFADGAMSGGGGFASDGGGDSGGDGGGE